MTIEPIVIYAMTICIGIGFGLGIGCVIIIVSRLEPKEPRDFDTLKPWYKRDRHGFLK